ncbi:ImmA/IrrE family metallo-endopeptidase [Nocardia sp. SYP-A9097]|uniref:ImmA/IrrE family metallo-endopeptidase n=1 Tax=Nocardia sp. SYP-A9097 TaxID=2663237 RepID=UPI00129AA084|nr:ImmA/IrrE family metallo-endopeptidase [Nocardia sp. SYP-A9097]MRH92124.1 ImmA/IrrE family metallo-endopeptidase [Nocardia sp. SYP-A9097]
MTAEAEGRAAAERFRNDHHLGFQPLGDLVALIEQTIGADVAVLETGPDQHGMTMRHKDRGTVYLAVARTLNPMRQRSTLAHELAHVVFQDWTDEPQVDSSGSAEVRANTFARHLLLPLTGVREMVATERDCDELSLLSKVVQRYLVSPSMAAISLEQVGYLDCEGKRRLKSETTPRLAARFGWSDQYKALQNESNHRRAPQRLLAWAIAGYLQNVISIQTIATLRGLDVDLVEDELNGAGLIPTGMKPIWSDPADLPEISIDLGELDADLGDSDAG